jgi:hypothetical protein
MDSKSHVTGMIEALRVGNASNASASFELAMKSHLNQALDERKVAIASQIYSKKD